MMKNKTTDFYLINSQHRYSLLEYLYEFLETEVAPNDKIVQRRILYGVIQTIDKISFSRDLQKSLHQKTQVIFHMRHYNLLLMAITRVILMKHFHDIKAQAQIVYPCEEDICYKRALSTQPNKNLYGYIKYSIQNYIDLVTLIENEFSNFAVTGIHSVSENYESWLNFSDNRNSDNYKKILHEMTSVFSPQDNKFVITLTLNLFDSYLLEYTFNRSTKQGATPKQLFFACFTASFSLAFPPGEAVSYNAVKLFFKIFRDLFPINDSENSIRTFYILCRDFYVVAKDMLCNMAQLPKNENRIPAVDNIINFIRMKCQNYADILSKLDLVNLKTLLKHTINYQKQYNQNKRYIYFIFLLSHVSKNNFNEFPGQVLHCFSTLPTMINEPQRLVLQWNSFIEALNNLNLSQEDIKKITDFINKFYTVDALKQNLARFIKMHESCKSILEQRFTDLGFDFFKHECQKFLVRERKIIEDTCRLIIYSCQANEQGIVVSLNKIFQLKERCNNVIYPTVDSYTDDFYLYILTTLKIENPDSQVKQLIGTFIWDYINLTQLEKIKTEIMNICNESINHIRQISTRNEIAHHLSTSLQSALTIRQNRNQQSEKSNVAEEAEKDKEEMEYESKQALP